MLWTYLVGGIISLQQGAEWRLQNCISVLFCSNHLQPEREQLCQLQECMCLRQRKGWRLGASLLLLKKLAYFFHAVARCWREGGMWEIRAVLYQCCDTAILFLNSLPLFLKSIPQVTSQTAFGSVKGSILLSYQSQILASWPAVYLHINWAV